MTPATPREPIPTTQNCLRRFRLGATLALAWLLWCAPSFAQPAAPATAPREPPAETPNPFDGFELTGRLLALGELSHSDSTPRRSSFDLELRSARAGFKYQTPLKWLSAELEVEFAGKPELKDAYARVRKRYFVVRAGHFKLPISALALESAFSLPAQVRGSIHDGLTDVLQVGGRRMGVALDLRARDPLDTTLTLGAFQGDKLVDGAFERISRESLDGQSLIARAEVHPGPFSFGLGFEHRAGPRRILEIPDVGSPRLSRPPDCDSACVTRYWTVGADAELNASISRLGLRAWVDAMAGSSWVEHEGKRTVARPLEGQLPVFLSARALVAVRFGGQKKEDAYLEPYALGGVLDPDTRVGHDGLWEWALGLNVGRWKIARLGVEGRLVRGERRLPSDFGDPAGTDPDRKSLLVQGGVAF